jgi:hypothetical protein
MSPAWIAPNICCKRHIQLGMQRISWLFVRRNKGQDKDYIHMNDLPYCNNLLCFFDMKSVHNLSIEYYFLHCMWSNSHYMCSNYNLLGWLNHDTSLQDNKKHMYLCQPIYNWLYKLEQVDKVGIHWRMTDKKTEHHNLS